jgi:DNA-binding CsgD family transcriptional regulator
VRLADQAAFLVRLVDGLREPLMVVGIDGGEIHRNPALADVLRREPQGERIEAEARAVGRGMARAPAWPSGVPRVVASVRTDTAEYRLWATWMPPGSFDGGETMLVSVEPLTAAMPNAETLATRFGLSRREAEVALLLATGHSDAAVGARLGISHHTVRHHGTHIFRKMGIRSRAALSLRVLGAPAAIPTGMVNAHPGAD